MHGAGRAGAMMGTVSAPRQTAERWAWDALHAAGGIAGRADLAARWGISRARVAVLTGRDDFPEPVATINGQPVWLTAEADVWKAGRPTTGRPPTR